MANKPPNDMDTLLRTRLEKAIACAFLLIILVACCLGWRRAGYGQRAEPNHVPAPPKQTPTPAVVQPPAEPKLALQGQHESFLSKLSDGEYVLPAGRHLTEEDCRLLAVTPDVKIIHRGPPQRGSPDAAEHARCQNNPSRLTGYFGVLLRDHSLRSRCSGRAKPPLGMVIRICVGSPISTGQMYLIG